MWGQVEHGERVSIILRIIPTRVGTSISLMCLLTQVIGSSPRVWGQATTTYKVINDSGIIPTRVGTSNPKGIAFINNRDHPHACGDKLSVRMYSQYSPGSSPRVWGQDMTLHAWRIYARIIPTRVGTSTKFRCMDLSGWDHPHACGDKTKEIKENSGFTKSTA